jgi:hypothetical protein
MEMKGTLKEKMNSRTWILTIFWNLILLLSLVVTSFFKVELPLGEIVGLAGGVTMAYLAKRAVQEHKVG